jgi:hypothetical protein
VSKVIVAAVTLVLVASLASGAQAGRSATHMVAPATAQRAAILKAFGSPGAPARCLRVGLAASNHNYATVRFRPVSGCARWGFNGVNVLQRQPSGRWRVRFEGSSYSCPRPRIPRQVQRDLGICP